MFLYAIHMKLYALIKELGVKSQLQICGLVVLEKPFVILREG